MITVVFWKWKKDGYRSTFGADQVNIAANMVRRNTTLPVRFLCVTDDPEGIEIDTVPLWDNPCADYGSDSAPNCFVRLKAFDCDVKEMFGPRFIWMDLDMVILGNIDHILSAPYDFAMWGDTRYNGQFNGSLCLMNAGARPQVWEDFKGMQSHKEALASGFFGSDQGWISYKTSMNGHKFGVKDGVYSFNIDMKNKQVKKPPKDAKIIFFHGQYDPWMHNVQNDYPWIKEHYR